MRDYRTEIRRVIGVLNFAETATSLLLLNTTPSALRYPEEVTFVAFLRSDYPARYRLMRTAVASLPIDSGLRFENGQRTQLTLSGIHSTDPKGFTLTQTLDFFKGREREDGLVGYPNACLVNGNTQTHWTRLMPSAAPTATEGTDQSWPTLTTTLSREATAPHPFGAEDAPSFGPRQSTLRLKLPEISVQSGPKCNRTTRVIPVFTARLAARVRGRAPG